MKAITIQTQNIGGGNISLAKQVAWCAINVDGIKITIDAYKDKSDQPREDSLIELIDEKDVYEIHPAKLFDIVRFYVKYMAQPDDIVHYRNRFHYIVPNEMKVSKKG